MDEEDMGREEKSHLRWKVGKIQMGIHYHTQK
jgi:hypothetical protein